MCMATEQLCHVIMPILSKHTGALDAFQELRVRRPTGLHYLCRWLSRATGTQQPRDSDLSYKQTPVRSTCRMNRAVLRTAIMRT